MRTWIFQGNPDDYDIDGYLGSRPAQLVWLVTRYASEIAVGDRVYLWRNQGKQSAIPGIIAEAIITAAPELRGEDPEGLRFWRIEGPRATSPQVRAVMRLVKVATAREVIRADWCNEDPILRGLPNLKMRAGTNYPIPPDQALRLDALWSRTGRDWTRSESIAGLMAYAETYGKPVSRLPGSPVARVALTVGRAVSGVYAKVMNFRSLDPRASGSGMSGAGDTDRDVWREFFDPQSSSLRLDALREEFTRLWGAEQPVDALPADASAVAAIVEDEADRLETLPLDQLLAKYAAQQSQSVTRPVGRVLTARDYDRNALVITIARIRASHKCEIGDCQHPPFETPDGDPYTEVHHIVPLAGGGEDTIENVACLCPAHHREIHLGRQAAELTAQLTELRAGKPIVLEPFTEGSALA
jgi:5-methylcytosine-specific restriction endonuclease McrA